MKHKTLRIALNLLHTLPYMASCNAKSIDKGCHLVRDNETIPWHEQVRGAPCAAQSHDACPDRSAPGDGVTAAHVRPNQATNGYSASSCGGIGRLYGKGWSLRNIHSASLDGWFSRKNLIFWYSYYWKKHDYNQVSHMCANMWRRIRTGSFLLTQCHILLCDKYI